MLKLASDDLGQIANWIAERSPDGAQRWLDAFDLMLTRIERRADSYAVASESGLTSRDIRQAFFRTRQGRIYRALFVIEVDEVVILRIRCPGQQELSDMELG